MRIGIQILSLRPGRVGGQGVFVRRLLRSLPPRLGQDRLVLFVRPELAAEPLFRSLAADDRVETIVENPESHYGDGYAAWNLRLLEAAVLDGVFFPLFFFHPRPLPIPVAIHVPDVQHEYLPENFSPDELAWRRERIPESIRLADAVIVPSAFTAGCLRERLGAGERPLFVVAEGGFAEEDLAEAAGEAKTTAVPPAGCPFFFYPAADWPHKNHEMLLRAMAILAREGRPEHLVLTGMLSRRGAALRGLAAELRIADRVHFPGCVSRTELIGLYRAARLMAFPSRFEGFGIPLVEAMQCGCPIVASRAGAIPETAGGAAVYCEDRPEAWARALARVSDDPALRAELRQRGRDRAGRFAWSGIATQLLRVLRDLCRTP